jgi:hypothetical protein
VLADAAAQSAGAHVALQHRVVGRQGAAVGHGEPDPVEVERDR